MELTHLLHRNLQCRPQRTALISSAGRRTHAQLHAAVAALAARLHSLGVQPGDRVALLSLNSIEGVTLMFACWWIGAIFCPVNTRWSVPEIGSAFDDCTPVLLFVDDLHAETADAACTQAGGTCRVLRLPDAGSLPAGAIDDRHGANDDIAALIYTGGTTGRSKGVQLSHRTLWSAAMSRLADGEPLHDSSTLVVTPIFHIAGVIRLLPHLMAGGACAILPQFKAGEALSLIEREGVTELALVPSMLQMLLDHPEFEPQRLRSVRRLHYGAAPSAQAVLQAVARRLPWVGLYQAYGMTESMGTGTMSFPSDHRPEDWASGRATAAGRACSAAQVRIVDASGNDVAAGEVGEILLRGPIVSPGYWKRPQETAQAFRAGWLHTGDAGRLDADGYLYVVDRLKDMIVSGGENIYSAEVENALASHAAVSACAVIGIPSDQWGEAVHAVVVLRDGASADAAGLQAHCRTLLAAYKLPKSLSFLPALPLTAAGKVAKNLLREPHWQGLERGVN